MVSENKVILNKIPSQTWSWCRMNKAELSYEAELENVLPEVRGECDGVEYSENGTGLWDKMPETTGGAGKDADDLFEEVLPVGLVAKKGKKIEAPVVLEYSFAEGSAASGAGALTAQIIKAEEDAEITVIVVSSSDKNAGGLQALKTEIVAEANAKVHLIKVQLLGKDFVQVDETASYAAENAKIEVTHVVLGGGKTYVGVGSSLKEYKSNFVSDLAYFARDEQVIDLNYIVRQFGKKTDCRMTVKGTLRDNAKKTYRGTIDFVKGCAGSKGNEQEEVLQLSPKTVNNSIPVILCDEEDVEGEHGASIGRLSDEVLFYMESRGISVEEAEKLMARAKVQSVASKITDEKVSNQVAAFMDDLFGEI